MTYIIAEPCIDIRDLSCVDVCPVDCIHQGERMLVIDPEECIDCGACEPECPVDAIKRSVELLKRTWGENAIGNVGLGLVFGLLIFYAWKIIPVYLNVAEAQGGSFTGLASVTNSSTAAPGVVVAAGPAAQVVEGEFILIEPLMWTYGVSTVLLVIVTTALYFWQPHFL